ncbi:SDR family oxidoreductase [bacterium]|nr:SDR family oxidoreductase [bacterium]MCI0602278.1 SDR family oxidoreductase [bacterium]
MLSKSVLITGGYGYLGRRIAREFLEKSDIPVQLWIKAKDRSEFKAKGQELCHELCETGGRLRLHAGDLLSEEPFAEIDSAEISTILHTAAVTRFNVDRETAQRVNVEGTEKLLRFAESCPNLNQVVFLSTIYASGLQAGEITEQLWDGEEGFSNYYEWSKWSSEQLLSKQYSHLPSKILRVATVIADSTEGQVFQQNAFHNTLKLIYYGLLSILPGKPQTPLYFVTGDFVTKATYELMHTPEQGTIYHVSHTKNESLTLSELIDLIFEVFEQQEDFKKRRILKPLYSDNESFKLLVDAVHQFAGGVVHQAVSSVAPFSQQLYLSKDVQNSNLRSVLQTYNAPDPAELIKNTCRYLVQTRWGKND